MTDHESAEHREEATPPGSSLLRVEPELRFFNAFMRKILPAVVLGAMVLAAVAAAKGQGNPLIPVLVMAPPIGIACAAVCYGLGYIFFRMQAGHFFEAYDDGLQITLSDFDDRISWDQVRDVCHRGNNMHLNTSVRVGSMELHFINPESADRLYRIHYEKTGYARDR